jgi:hypothetical protein
LLQLRDERVGKDGGQLIDQGRVHRTAPHFVQLARSSLRGSIAARQRLHLAQREAA